MTANTAAKFDRSRAEEYAHQSRIALAGYDACHELSACILAASLPEAKRARVLVVGEEWSFVAVDPSPSMVEVAKANLTAAGQGHRVDFVLGSLADIPTDRPFDAAIMIGVLHHLSGDISKREIMVQLADRLKAGAPVVLAGNYRPYLSEPLFMAAWAQRWRMNGSPEDEVRAKMGRILEGAEPLRSEEALARLLGETGFETPLRFFASLFWGAWVTTRSPDGNES